MEVLVAFVPDDYQDSWTLASSVFRRGVGLHSGEESEVRIHPTDQVGFHVSWLNNPDLVFTLKADQVKDSVLCTCLELGYHNLSTVEHLLAALSGYGLTHVHIEVSGEEIPLLDGSALGWIEAIKEAGIVSAASPRAPLIKLKEPLIFHRGKSVISAVPAENFNIVGIIDFPYGAIGRQVLEIDLTPNLFIDEIAPARTFGFKDQVNNLKASGLIKGGSLENALVCDGDNWLNPPLRFEDEPIRHKLLDLIGDLALVGFPQAQVIVYKGSHGLHNDLASALLNH